MWTQRCHNFSPRKITYCIKSGKMEWVRENSGIFFRERGRKNTNSFFTFPEKASYFPPKYKISYENDIACYYRQNFRPPYFCHICRIQTILFLQKFDDLGQALTTIMRYSFFFLSWCRQLWKNKAVFFPWKVSPEKKIPLISKTSESVERVTFSLEKNTTPFGGPHYGYVFIKSLWRYSICF